MRIAIPVHKEKISSFFGLNRQLLIIEVRDGREEKRWEVPLEKEWPLFQSFFLYNLKVEILICDGISTPLADLLKASEVTVVSQQRGEVDKILAAYMTSHLTVKRAREQLEKKLPLRVEYVVSPLTTVRAINPDTLPTREEIGREELSREGHPVRRRIDAESPLGGSK